MSFPQGGQSSGSKQLWDYTFNVNNFFSGGFIAQVAGTAVFTLSGKGIVGTIQVASSGAAIINGTMPMITIDGIDYDLAANSGSTHVHATIQGGLNFTGTAANSVQFFDLNIKFKNSFAFKYRSLTGAPSGTYTIVVNTIYYT